MTAMRLPGIRRVTAVVAVGDRGTARRVRDGTGAAHRRSGIRARDLHFPPANP